MQSQEPSEARVQPLAAESGCSCPRTALPLRSGGLRHTGGGGGTVAVDDVLDSGECEGDATSTSNEQGTGEGGEHSMARTT